MALMNVELVGYYIDACMEVDHLRVLLHMMKERRSMVQTREPHHVRPQIQGDDESGTPTAGPRHAARQTQVTNAKAAETKTPNKREKMEK
jgi:hypothetical protein